MAAPTPNPHRIDSLAAPATTPNPPLHPFTQPLFPETWTRIAAAVVAIAAILLPFVPPGPVQAVLGVLTSLGAALGIASPGIQKRPPESSDAAVIDDRQRPAP